jgi:hypothetical protein
MSAEQTCDFCQSTFEWSAEQIALDIRLRLMGSGLGAMCDACGERDIAASVKHERLERRRERARERANGT